MTDSIHDHMTRHFGEENVFLDVGSIPFGVDFRRYLADQIAAHDVVLVIIGPDWARIMQERAGQDNDFVRIEIESALKQNKLVVPVLVMEARMPNFAELPASIGELQWRNSATIRRKPDLRNDCDRLAADICRQNRSSVPLKEAPQSTSSGFVTMSERSMPLIKIKEVATLYPERRYAEGPAYKWSLEIETSSHVLDQIAYVVYQLHPSFKNPIREVNKRSTNFRMNTMGWGKVNVAIIIYFKDKSIGQINYQVKLDTKHS